MQNYTNTIRNDSDNATIYTNDEGGWHRLDGPAWEWDNRLEDDNRFWINDSVYLEKHYWSHPDVVKFMALKKLKTALGV